MAVMKRLESPAIPHKAPWYRDGLQFYLHAMRQLLHRPRPATSGSTTTKPSQIADYLKIKPQAFRERYAHTINNRWSLNEQKTPHGYDCVFLDRDDQGKALCRIYPVRPTQCRTWPFWPENLNRPSDWHRAAKTCPGIDQGKLYTIDQITITRDSNPTK